MSSKINNYYNRCSHAPHVPKEVTNEEIMAELERTHKAVRLMDLGVTMLTWTAILVFAVLLIIK